MRVGRETLDNNKQEAAKEFDITMGTCGKTYKKLYARRNKIAKTLDGKGEGFYCGNFPMDIA